MNDLNFAKTELIEFWKDNFNFSKEVISAFKKVPRENFILPEFINEVYGDFPLPIGKSQTISQPTTVMIMLDLLEIQKNDRILEIGCGSGYNAALMSKIATKGEIITCDIIESLAEKAKINLQEYKNVEVIAEDGFKIAKKRDPFDKIILTAAARAIPDVLIDNLNKDGIIVAPVGDPFAQKMIRLRKEKGKIIKETHGDFMFVPIRGEFGQQKA